MANKLANITESVVLVVLLIVASLVIISTVQKLNNIINQNKELKKAVEIVSKREMARKIEKEQNPDNERFVVPFGQTAYAVSSKDGLSVAYANRKSKEVTGDCKVFMGSGYDYVFAAVLVRVADFGFISEETFRKAIPLMTLTQKQNLAITGRVRFRGENILVVQRRL